MHVWRPGVISNLKRCRPQNHPQHHYNYWTPISLQLERSPTRPQTLTKKVKFSDLPFNASETPWQSPKEMIDRWTYGSLLRSSHPSKTTTRNPRLTSEGGGASLPLFPHGAPYQRPPVHHPSAPPTLSPVGTPPNDPPRVIPRVSPPGTPGAPPKCAPHDIPRGIFTLPPREAAKSGAGGENEVKDLVRPPSTPEDAA